MSEAPLHSWTPNSGDLMVVIGAGGHAKVVVELARSIGVVVVGCTDRDGGVSTVVGAPVLGDDSVLESLRREGVGLAAVALGDNAARVRAGAWARSLGFELPPLVSPSATVSNSMMVGEGAIVMPGAVVNAEARIGAFAIINTSASVDHDGDIGAGAHIAPGAHLSGSVTVGRCALVGVGATVLPGVRIGANAVLGGGSVAIADIADGETAVGSPARTIFRS